MGGLAPKSFCPISVCPKSFWAKLPWVKSFAMGGLGALSRAHWRAAVTPWAWASSTCRGVTATAAAGTPFWASTVSRSWRHSVSAWVSPPEEALMSTPSGATLPLCCSASTVADTASDTLR